MHPTSSFRNQCNPDGAPAAVHLYRRIFIGPMPEKLISQAEAHAHKHHHRGIFLGRAQTQESDPNNVTKVSQIVKDHAFYHFMYEGGREEDWGEAEERGRTEALLERWRESEWGALWHRRHRRHDKEPQYAWSSSWIGASFEVGRLLGVSILDEPIMADLPSHPIEISDVPTNTTFVFPLNQSDSFPEAPGTPRDVSPTPTASDTNLLRSHKDTMNTASSSLQVTRSQVISSSKFKGKGKKQVHYNEEVQELATPRPASPTEVLGRTSATVETTTSAAASVQSSPDFPLQSFSWRDVVFRGTQCLTVYGSRQLN